MENTFSGIKSLRIFFSYSTQNKIIVGNLKESLEPMGFDVFLAHEDIKPCIEWYEEIIKNLERCDIFIPLLTKEFKESDWTDQEIGMALALNKFIIPLQADVTPYGFIGKIQGLKMKNRYSTANEIFKAIKNRSQFGEDMKNFIINSLMNSSSFEQAKIRARLLEDFEEFSSEQIKRIYNAIKDNGQINGSFGAQTILKRFFNKHKQYLEINEYEEILNLLR